MGRVASLFVVFVFFAVVSGCASVSTSSAQADVDSAGDIRKIAGSLHMVPVPLYGDSGLSLGLRHQSSGLLQLDLCDARQRVTATDKPLVLYLDGELAYLQPQSEKPANGCSHYKVSAEQLYRVSHCNRVLLRVFFDDEIVEQRVSGMVSDYFSRPKYYGPQERMKRFIDALPKETPINQLVGG